jgi:hypothetical protein
MRLRLKTTARLLAALTMCFWPAAASGVVVLPKGSDKPVMGYLVRQDERTVVVREERPSGKTRDIPFAKSDIDELIITVSPERLAELDPARPHLYREYAEELVEKQRDPEARDMAIRLYAICAARGGEKLRRGALLGLIALARTPEEERLFRAAAYLHDVHHDAAILAEPSATTPITAAASEELLSGLRLARQGKSSAAKAILDRPTVRAYAVESVSIIALDDLEKACAGGPLGNELLLKLLQAELALESAGDSKMLAGPAGHETSWSQARRSRGLAPQPLISLDKLTEFDPAACVFRDGKWVRP